MWSISTAPGPASLVNLALIEEIAESISIPVEFGGGVRTLDDLKMINDGPVSRVVLGTERCDRSEPAAWRRSS